MKKFESVTEIEIPFFDVDMMNVVWHGNYVKYLEVARCDLLKKINYTYEDMKQDGVAYPIAKMDLKFINSAYFAQKIKISAILEEIEPCMVIKYHIYDEKRSILKAKSMQICVDLKSGESIYLPPERLKEAVL